MAPGQRAHQISLIGDRATNQDRLLRLDDGDRRLLIVADGMGGHAEGAAAAQCVLDAAEELFPGSAGTPTPRLLQTIALRAHEAIAGLRPELPESEQPRTTAVFCLVEGSVATFGHAGDSRGYLLRDGQILVCTRDHSVVEMMVRQGKLEADQTRGHPLRHQVSRCLGGSQPPPLEFTPCPPLKAGDCLLLCSDGFWEPLSDEELAGEAPETSLFTLSQRAIDRNTRRADNCTALRFVLKDV